MHTLDQLGWSPERARQLSDMELGLEAARVLVVERGGWLVQGEGWQGLASCAGRLVHDAVERTELPAVGDWVAVEREQGSVRIEAVLPRTSSFVRKAAGGENGQIIAANLDRVFVVTAVGGDFNPRRVERYVAAVRAGGADPIVVVNKCDLPYDPLELVLALEQAAPGVPLAFVSAASDDGISELEPHLEPAVTIALVGSSGVGKSTLVNRLVGREVQKTQAIRVADDKGRHTTTRRELLVTPDGYVLIDTPGMRELGLFDAQEGVGAAFGELERLAAGCRFADCRHVDEPGCAVLAAVESGELSAARLDSYRKLQREAAYERRRHDRRAAEAEARRWKSITKEIRKRYKDRDG